LLACEVRGDGDEMCKFIRIVTYLTRANEVVIVSTVRKEGGANLRTPCPLLQFSNPEYPLPLFVS